MQSPGSIEEHRVSRLRRDKGHRVPFLWFVSLGKQRNEQKAEEAQIERSQPLTSNQPQALHNRLMKKRPELFDLDILPAGVDPVAQENHNQIAGRVYPE